MTEPWLAYAARPVLIGSIVFMVVLALIMIWRSRK